MDNMFIIFEKSFNNKHIQFLKETEAKNLEMMNRSRQIYARNMHDLLTRNRNISLDELRIGHVKLRNEAIQSFEAFRDERDQSFEKYLRSLNESIDEFYIFLQNQCTSNSVTRWENIKNILKITFEYSLKAFQVLAEIRRLRR